MKRVICNQCRKEDAQDTYARPPKGWFELHRAGYYEVTYNDVHLCSTTCLVAFGQARANDEWHATLPPVGQEEVARG